MTDFLSQQISPPEYWQEFEKLCADLWGRIWSDENTQMNGRTGQAQHGVDVYGKKNKKGDWVGVQCKGKDGRYGQSVSDDELYAEVEKAKSFIPPLKEFILATTAPVDAKIQQTAREITADFEKKGIFSVNVMGWAEIHRRLADYDDLIEKYYPNQGSKISDIHKKFDTIVEEQFKYEEAHSEDSNNLNEVKNTLKQIQTAVISNGLLPKSEDHESSILEKNINDEIDGYRDLLNANKPSTAMPLLEKLKTRCWHTASNWVKFRITTNIASAYLNLGDDQKASALFKEANLYEPENEKSICNLGLAYLLEKEYSKAKKTVNIAIAKWPDNKRAYALLVSSCVNEIVIDRPEDLVPNEHLANFEVAYSIAHFYRERGNDKDTLNWISKAYELNKENLQVRIAYASIILESIFSDQMIYFGKQINDTDQKTIESVRDIFFEIWKEVKNSETAVMNIANAINLIIIERWLKNETAIAIADEALIIDPNSFELKNQKAILLFGKNDYPGACEILETIVCKNNFQSTLLYAEALKLAGDCKKALNIVNQFLKYSEENKEKSIVETIRLKLLLEEEGCDAAIEAAKAVLKKYPDSVAIMVESATIFKNCGDSKTKNDLIHKTMGILKLDSEYEDKFLVADFLFEEESFNEAVDLYRGLVKYYNNSRPLRRLLVCLYETDHRKEILELFKKIPKKTKQLSFFRRLASAVYVRIGDLDAAISQLEEYLKIEPEDLAIRLNWIKVLLNRDETDKIYDYLFSLKNIPNASPIDQMHLAHLFDYFGFSKKAVELAYRILEENPQDPAINLGYVGLWMMGKTVAAIQKPTEIVIDTAFTIKDDYGDIKTYIILDKNIEDFKENEIYTKHPVALAATGKSVGDRFKINKNPYQEIECEIVEIKSKYIHLLHVTMKQFSDRFPSNNSLVSINVKKPGENEFCFDPIFKSLTDRKNYVSDILYQYQNQPYSIGIIATLVGVNPLRLWKGLLADPSVKIFCCDGTGPERQLAMAIIKKMKNRFVVEPLTLYSLHALNLQDVIEKIIGRLRITVDRLFVWAYMP
jgi:tetratricopeptide (TPR) repeat protein